MIDRAYLLSGVVIGAALLYVASKGASKTGANIGAAAVDMADGVLSGVVISAGERVGIPATNESECDRAIAAGDTWAASFACPAVNFLRYVTGQKSGGASGGW